MKAMGIDVGGSGFRIGVFDTTTGALQGELERHQHASSTAPDAVLSALEIVLADLGWEGPIGMGFPGAVEAHSPVSYTHLTLPTRIFG